MANNRLTWNSVAAPDFSDALQGNAIATRLFGEGFGSLAAALGNRQDRQKEEASAQALMNAEKYTSSDQWNRAMAEQGVEGALGVNASQLTTAALESINGRGRGLALNEGTAINNAAGALDLQTKQYDQSRTVKANAESDADKESQRLAAEHVDKAYFLGIDKEADRQTILNDRSLDAKTRATRLSAFDQRVGELYTPTQAAMDQVASMPTVAHISQGLGIYENDKLFKNSTDSDGVAWASAQEQFGNTKDVFKSLLTNLDAYNGKIQSEDGEAPVTFTTSAGKVKRIFEAAKERYGKDMPDSVIAQAIQENVRSGYWLLNDGQELKLDEGAAWNQLDKFADPVRRKELEDNRLAQLSESSAVTRIKTDLAKAANELSLAITKKLPQDVIDAKMAEIKAIEERAGAYLGVMSDGTLPKSVQEALAIKKADEDKALRVSQLEDAASVSEAALSDMRGSMEARRLAEHNALAENNVSAIPTDPDAIIRRQWQNDMMSGGNSSAYSGSRVVEDPANAAASELVRRKAIEDMMRAKGIGTYSQGGAQSR